MSNPFLHIWCAFVDEIDDRLLVDYERLLSGDERERWSRFVFPRDRRRYLVTRALARTVLSRYAEVAPNAWTFGVNRFGKPHITNDHFSAKDLTFNLTHADRLVALAVTRRAGVGIDTERLRGFDGMLGVAEGSLAADELASLRSLPLDLQPRRFFEYWTLKESYLKARSTGLSIPLHACTFRFSPPERIAMTVDPAVDGGGRWRLWQGSIAREYVTAVCAERLGPDPPNLVWKKVVPLSTDEDLACEHLATGE